MTEEPTPAAQASLPAQITALVRTARSAHPDWNEWALTMSGETFALLNPPAELIEAPDPLRYAPRTARRWQGCEVYAFPLLLEVVTCSPVLPFSPGFSPTPAGPSAPPDFHLNLTTGQITAGEYP